MIGNWQVIYSYTDPSGCSDTDSAMITVVNLTAIAAAGPDITICSNGGVVQLNATPINGSWTTTPYLTANGAFDPALAGLGPHVITFCVGAGTCLSCDQRTITVTAPPVVNAGVNISVCQNASAQPLNAGTPAGGIWTGTGVIGGGPYFFDPAIALPNNTLTYTFTDVVGCVSSATMTASVVPPPIANAGPDTTLCDQSIAYPLVGSPLGGVWSGGAPYLTTPPPVFTPVPGNFGVFALTYVYTDISGCSDTDMVNITVVDLTVIAQAGNDTTICLNGGAVQMNASPANGSWTPTPFLTASGMFDPVAAGLGAHVITFCVGAGTCLSCDQRSITVVAPPVVSSGPDLEFCVYEPVQDLAENPQGGAWSGSIGLIDANLGLFDPGVAPLGDNFLTYTYTDPLTNCVNSDQTTITINYQPTASFICDSIACQNAPFFFNDLSAGNSTWQWDFGDGSPLDITPFPSHVYANTGTYTVTLIVGTGANCTDTVSRTVIVWPSPTVDFTIDQNEGCGPLQVAFTNNSTGPGVGYTWDFG